MLPNYPPPPIIFLLNLDFEFLRDTSKKRLKGELVKNRVKMSQMEGQTCSNAKKSR